MVEPIRDEVNTPDAAPPTPGWVKLLAVVALIILAVVVAMHLAGAGLGPGAHAPIDHGQQTSP